MKDKLSEVSRRVRGYWFVDGLAEIGSGILLMVLGIPYLASSLPPDRAELGKYVTNSKNLIILIGLIILFFVIRIIKQNSTIRRSGYIGKRPPELKILLRIGLIILGCSLLSPVLIGGFRLFPNFRPVFLNSMYYLPSIYGFFIAAGLMVTRSHTSINRFYILAGVAALLSVGLMWFSTHELVSHPFHIPYFASMGFKAQFPREAAALLLTLFRFATEEVGIFFAFFGLAILISGLIARHKYLNMNPLLREAANGQ